MGSHPDLEDFEIKDPRIAKCVLCFCAVVQIYFGLAIASQLMNG
tara:strand:- start:153 stop:284 length:132 start_codon:yes stop_codon:yes gene_type:complete